MKHRLYRAILRLHPRDFRERFASQMLGIFDEAGGGGWLVRDALVSLLRQRLLRGSAWRVVPVIGLAFAAWVLIVWLIARMPLAGPPRTIVPSIDFMLIAAVASVIPAVLTTVLVLTWHRIRRPPARRTHA